MRLGNQPHLRSFFILLTSPFLGLDFNHGPIPTLGQVVERRLVRAAMEGAPRLVGGRLERSDEIGGWRQRTCGVLSTYQDGSRPAQAGRHVLRPARDPLQGGRRSRRESVRRAGGGHGAGRVHSPTEELLRSAVTTGAAQRGDSEKKRERESDLCSPHHMLSLILSRE
jgi:hypothetical protein